MNVKLTTVTPNSDFKTEYAALLGVEFHNFRLTGTDCNRIRFQCKRVPASCIAKNLEYRGIPAPEIQSAELVICVTRDSTYPLLSVRFTDHNGKNGKRNYIIQANRLEVIQFADQYINLLPEESRTDYERWAHPQTLEDALKVLQQY